MRAVDAGVGPAGKPGVPHAERAEDPYGGLVCVAVAGHLLDEQAEHGVVDVPVLLPLAGVVRRSLGDGRGHHLLRGEGLEAVGVHLLGRRPEARAGTQPAGVGEQMTHRRGLGERRREQAGQVAGDGGVEIDTLLRDELEHDRRRDHLGGRAGPEARVRQRGCPVRRSRTPALPAQFPLPPTRIRAAETSPSGIPVSAFSSAAGSNAPVRGAVCAAVTVAGAGCAAAVPARGTSSREEASKAEAAVTRARAVVREVMEGLRSRRWVLRTGPSW